MKKKNGLKRGNADLLYNKAPGVYGFLRDRGVSEEISEDCHDFVTEYAMSHGKILDQAYLLKIRLPKIQKKVTDYADTLERIIEDFEELERWSST